MTSGGHEWRFSILRRFHPSRFPPRASPRLRASRHAPHARPRLTATVFSVLTVLHRPTPADPPRAWTPASPSWSLASSSSRSWSVSHRLHPRRRPRRRPIAPPSRAPPPPRARQSHPSARVSASPLPPRRSSSTPRRREDDFRAPRAPRAARRRRQLAISRVPPPIAPPRRLRGGAKGHDFHLERVRARRGRGRRLFRLDGGVAFNSPRGNAPAATTRPLARSRASSTATSRARLASRASRACASIFTHATSARAAARFRVRQRILFFASASSRVVCAEIPFRRFSPRRSPPPRRARRRPPRLSARRRRRGRVASRLERRPRPRRRVSLGPRARLDRPLRRRRRRRRSSTSARSREFQDVRRGRRARVVPDAPPHTKTTPDTCGNIAWPEHRFAGGRGCAPRVFPASSSPATPSWCQRRRHRLEIARRERVGRRLARRRRAPKASNRRPSRRGATSAMDARGEETREARRRLPANRARPSRRRRPYFPARKLRSPRDRRRRRRRRTRRCVEARPRHVRDVEDVAVREGFAVRGAAAVYEDAPRAGRGRARRRDRGVCARRRCSCRTRSGELHVSVGASRRQRSFRTPPASAPDRYPP